MGLLTKHYSYLLSYKFNIPRFVLCTSLIISIEICGSVNLKLLHYLLEVAWHSYKCASIEAKRKSIPLFMPRDLFFWLGLRCANQLSCAFSSSQLDGDLTIFLTFLFGAQDHFVTGSSLFSRLLLELTYLPKRQGITS